MRLRTLSVALLASVAFAEDKPSPAPAAATPPPEFIGELSLVCYDLPRGLSDGYAPTRQLAVRRDDQDGVEWPDFTLNGESVFRGRATELLPLKLRRGGEAASLFQLPSDDIVQPGGHWFRAMLAPGNRKYLYTADKTARCDMEGTDPRGRWELWLFPLKIEGEGGPTVKNVVLREGNGPVVFRRNGPWRSLTLLLPANAPGHRYSLSVDGRGEVAFDIGLMPAKPGNPVERTYAVDTRVPGEGPKIRVYTPSRPAAFPNQKEWDADRAMLAKLVVPPAAAKVPPPAIRKPVSPMLVYAAALPHGLSGGFWRKGTKADEYARGLAQAGFDAVFESAPSLPAPAEAESLEARGAAFAHEGVRLGLQYDQSWSRPSLQHPNLGFLAHTLPEWHRPLYRSLQLAAQRFARTPNFAGIMIGAENTSYTYSRSLTVPSYQRPWGEAMIEFTGSPSPLMVRLPGEKSEDAPNAAGFVKWIDRFDASFHQYGYFAEAVRSVDPNVAFTTGSYGSSPGAGARGGWPWASIPGRIMFEGLPVQQAYDWNELHSSKPMHLVALIDRLRSYWPKTPTWALVDNANLFFGREAWQRATALALTRGVQGIGTNFVVPSVAGVARPDFIAAQREMADWIHKYAATFAATEPDVAVGIYFGMDQALMRPVNTNHDAPLDQLLAGSHEGKVTEALWLCHAAGYPARVVTQQEMLRGPLPASMKAILLVGLGAPDRTWSWDQGLAPALQQFRARGGKIFTDSQSACPVDATPLEFSVAAYVTQSELDATPRLIERNRDNIQQLRRSLRDIVQPVASSDDPTLWAVPTRVKDLIYVTTLNWAYAEGDEAKEFVRAPDARATRPEVWKTKANASLYVKPREASLRWNTERPIYDVRAQRVVDEEDASTIDFSRDGFQWFALPPHPPTDVVIRVVQPGQVSVDVKAADGSVMLGFPLEVGIRESSGIFHVRSAISGDRLNLGADIEPGVVTMISATELLTGMKAQEIELPAPPLPAAAKRGQIIGRFLARKGTPVVVALTPEQAKDPAFDRLAKDFAAKLKAAGRNVRIGIAGPQDVVESLQRLRSPHRFPQWQTIPADLVLFGTPKDNVLMLDQLRGEIFPANFNMPSKGQGRLVMSKSPFVGECDVLNVVAADPDGVLMALAE